MKQIIKKLNNFRLTASIASGLALLAGLLSLGSLFLYHFAGETNGRGFRIVGFNDKPVVGFIYFMIILVTIILSITVIYLLLPSVRNKEKIVPSRTPLLLATISAGFQLALLVLSIVLIVTETPNTKVGFIVLFPFEVITIIGSALCILPYIKCSFYMPAIGQKK